MKKLLYLFIVVITLSSCSIEIHKNTSSAIPDVSIETNPIQTRC